MTLFNHDNVTLETAYVALPSFSTQAASGGKTISGWFRLHALPADTETLPIVSIGMNTDGAGVDARWTVQAMVSTSVNGNSNCYIRLLSILQNGLTRPCWFRTTALQAGELYLFTIHTSGSAWSCYINGVSQTAFMQTNSNNGQWTGNVFSSNCRYYLGANYNIGTVSIGATQNRVALAQLVHWNVSLSAGEVTELYNGGLGLPLRFHRQFANVQAAYGLGRDCDYDASGVVPALVGSEPFTVSGLTNANNLVYYP